MQLWCLQLDHPVYTEHRIRHGRRADWREGSTFSTNNGYDTYCYVNTDLDCNGASDGHGGYFPTWMVYPGHTMLGNQTLVPSSSGYQAELFVEVYWNSDGWWLYSGVNKVTPSSSTPVYPTTYQGYFVASSYTGPMSAGQAQTFQAGGEVLDSDGS